MWQKADELVMSVYSHTKTFPKHEMFGITSQLRRAALSVALNIIEGYGRRIKGDFRRFLDIALGSMAEVEYLLELSNNLSYISDSDYGKIEETRSECGKLIWSYRSKLKHD